MILLCLMGCGQNTSSGKSASKNSTSNFIRLSPTLFVADTIIQSRMNQQEFWRIIDKASQEALGNDRVQEASLIRQLTNYPLEDIIGFERILRQTLFKADDYKAVAALKIIQGWVTDDSYLYFRCWLIAQGQATFREALRNPEYLVDKCEKGSFPNFESLLYVADEAYVAKTSGSMDDENLPREVVYKEGLDYNTFTPPTKGEDFTIDQLPVLYPQLWKKFR